MKIANEFIRLPLRFDVQRLTDEVQAFSSEEWMPHVQQFPGNVAIPLISLNGEMNNDFNGPMAATDKLRRSPYIQQVLASFGEVFGRSRLMGLDAGCSVPEHRDVNYHWYSRVRIHIPIISNDQVTFYCGDKNVHMAPGEAWIFDSWKCHRVENRSDQFRVHLVVDTAGSSRFWRMVEASEWRSSSGCEKPASVADVAVEWVADVTPDIQTERFNAPLVMAAGEVDALVLDILQDVHAFNGNAKQPLHRFDIALQDFRREWRRLWSLFGTTPGGWPHYGQLLQSMPARMPRIELKLASNQGSAVHTFGQRVLASALNTGLAEQYRT